MSDASWAVVVDRSDELDDGTARDPDGGQVKEAIRGPESGGPLGRSPGHAPRTEDVPEAVEGLGDADRWERGGR